MLLRNKREIQTRRPNYFSSSFSIIYYVYIQIEPLTEKIIWLLLYTHSPLLLLYYTSLIFHPQFATVIFFKLISSLKTQECMHSIFFSTQTTWIYNNKKKKTSSSSISKNFQHSFSILLICMHAQHFYRPCSLKVYITCRQTDQHILET